MSDVYDPNPRAARLDAVARALARLATHADPAVLADGLSAPMAARCLALALGELERGALEATLRHRPDLDATVLFVAARGVFTSPIEWVAQLAALGAGVHVKAPRAAPALCEALAHAFSDEGLPVRASISRRFPEAHAVMAMGDDATMRALARRFRGLPLSLHGHRFSVAVVRGDDPATARALADDVVLYDGRGCFTPAGIFVLPPGHPDRLADGLDSALRVASLRWPRGAIDPALGPEWRRRTGLARVRGRAIEGPDFAVLRLDASFFEPSALPRLVSVHGLPDPDALLRLLLPWKGHLAACATDLPRAPEALDGAGFERLCAPGRLQIPPLDRRHGGRDVLAELAGGA